MEAVIHVATQPVVLIVGGIFAAVALFHVLSTRRRSGPRSRSRSVDPLVRACFGDSHKADRLMMYEIRRAPGISKSEARERAVERLERDRNRS